MAGCKRAFTRKDALLKHAARVHLDVSQCVPRPCADLEPTKSSYRQGTAASTTLHKSNSLTSSHGNGTLSANPQTAAGAAPAALRAHRKGAPIHREIVSQLADQMAAATAKWRRGGLDGHKADAPYEALDGPDSDDSEHDNGYMEND